MNSCGNCIRFWARPKGDLGTCILDGTATSQDASCGYHSNLCADPPRKKGPLDLVPVDTRLGASK